MYTSSLIRPSTVGPARAGRCGVGRVGYSPPKILVGWATMHLAYLIIRLFVR